MKTVDISETIAASDLKFGRIYEDMWVLKFKVISWPWPKVVYKQKFKLDFLWNYCADLNQILYESFQVQGNENLIK